MPSEKYEGTKTEQNAQVRGGGAAPGWKFPPGDALLVVWQRCRHTMCALARGVACGEYCHPIVIKPPPSLRGDNPATALPRHVFEVQTLGLWVDDSATTVFTASNQRSDRPSPYVKL
jgi:hypothetical protein